MRVCLLQECMDFMMNAKEGILFHFGVSSALCLIIYHYRLALMKEYYVCMEGSHLIYIIYLK